jgi:hypothetical protein
MIPNVMERPTRAPRNAPKANIETDDRYISILSPHVGLVFCFLIRENRNRIRFVQSTNTFHS